MGICNLSCFTAWVLRLTRLLGKLFSLFNLFTAILLQGVESHLCQLLKAKNTHLPAYSSSTETLSFVIVHTHKHSSHHILLLFPASYSVRFISCIQCLEQQVSSYHLTSQPILILFLTSQHFMLHVSHMTTQSPPFCYRCHTRSC